MNGWIDNSYCFTIGAALLLSVLGVWFIAVLPSIDRWSRNFFLSYYSVLMMCCFTGLIGNFYPVSNAVIIFLLFISTLLLALTMPMMTVYLLFYCGERGLGSKLFRTVSGLWAVFLVLLITSLFSDAFCYFTPDNQFYRGNLYWVLLLPLAAIMLCNLVGTIARRNMLSRKAFRGFMIAMVPMTVTLFLNMFVDVFLLIDISATLAALAMYGFILSDQIEQDISRQREIADQRVNIMVLQMRPHFIYNTMTSIYCLCRQDPEKARQVVLDFTNYLRKNFTAIASAEPVPFASELDHTRAYLAIEQAQYEDCIFVDYDTKHKCFRVPPLTLQPIVENAVKHGRETDADSINISIRTRKTDSGSEIIVEDNGRGYAPINDSEPHIALENIQKRLEIMCGGRMVIKQGDNGGTVVKLTIPDSAVK